MICLKPLWRWSLTQRAQWWWAFRGGQSSMGFPSGPIAGSASVAQEHAVEVTTREEKKIWKKKKEKKQKIGVEVATQRKQKGINSRRQHWAFGRLEQAQIRNHEGRKRRGEGGDEAHR